MSSKIVIAVVGPTAIGKTSLGIAIAKHFNSEIISADSRQFFKEMYLGTAVPSPEELAQVPHHFIQHKSIHQPYSVGDYEREANEKLSELFIEKNHVVLVGGSGLYVDAVINGLDEFPSVAPEIRAVLNQRLRTEGLGVLQEELKQKDPKYYHLVDIQNPHRLIRALEVYEASGKPYSSFLNQKKEQKDFQALYVGLHADREVIYERINLRVDKMMEQGLLKEAENLYPHRALNALQTVGYKELFEYLDGNCSLDSAMEEIKKNTRRFAKRQLTWLRKNSSILWVDYDLEPSTIMIKITERLNTDYAK